MAELPLFLVIGLVTAVVVGVTRLGKSRVRKHGLLVLAWRWHSGQPWHGGIVTDAGWFRPGVRALTPTGHATRFWHLPRWKRAAWRSGGSLGAFLVLWLVLAAPELALWILAGTCTAGCGFGAWRLWRLIGGRKHRKTWLVPLHLAAHELAGIPRAALASSWLTVVKGADDAVESATLSLPQGWPSDAADKGRLVSMASAKLAIEAPEATWRSAGPSPQLVLRRSVPPPRKVLAADLLAEADKCRPDQIILGVGKRGDLVRVSTDNDSPHFSISCGTGGGKSNLAAWILLQVLRRGDICLCLDAKWISHPWLIGLPNVAYARSADELHAAMIWMGAEVDRRNQVAFRSVDVTGKIRADVGARVWTVAEELNLAMPRLKTYWSDLRDREDPRTSPAITGLGEVAFAGRAVKMNLVLIGQMLTAAATGSGSDSSVKENIGAKCLARYSPKNWKMQAEEWPMPPRPTVLGRIQVVTASGVRETQVPLVDLAEARELVLAGTVTPCPAGMPGRQVLGETAVAEIEPWDDTPPWPADVTVSGNGPRPLAPKAVTLSEAVAIGILHPDTKLGALRMARHRGDLPPATGLRGLAQEFDPAALAAWDLDRRARR